MLKVLLVEDDLIVQRVHTLMLNKLGCHVDVAPNGAIAIEKVLENSDYKIVFVDIGLPDMSGFELIKKLRTLKIENSLDLPIIALTGFIGQEEEHACFEAGATEVMHKPVINSTLRELLDRHAVF